LIVGGTFTVELGSERVLVTLAGVGGTIAAMQGSTKVTVNVLTTAVGPFQE
jgi:hypothetical protein